ncbi:MAG: prepilin-type N-terminal cleavage/methylation domain-containing protein [Thermodesulfobacteriota bacterium]|nr:prepilin-type N-terminal cleavage/methylation domain-containing protein [Thermodesulfobacteriota bacterium]
MRRKQEEKGFTLIELLIVVIIIGILTAVGVPLYMGYVKDAKVSSAKAVIGTIVNAEKAYNQKTGTFLACPVADFSGFIGNSAEGFLNIDVRDASQHWDLAVVLGADPDNQFTVTATGKGDYAGTTVQLDYDRAADEVWTIT